MKSNIYFFCSIMLYFNVSNSKSIEVKDASTKVVKLVHNGDSIKVLIDTLALMNMDTYRVYLDARTFQKKTMPEFDQLKKEWKAMHELDSIRIHGLSSDYDSLKTAFDSVAFSSLFFAKASSIKIDSIRIALNSALVSISSAESTTIQLKKDINKQMNLNLLTAGCGAAAAMIAAIIVSFHVL